MKLFLNKILIFNLLLLIAGSVVAQSSSLEVDQIDESEISTYTLGQWDAPSANENYKEEVISEQQFDEDKWRELSKNISFDTEEKVKEKEKETKEASSPFSNGISKTAKAILFGLAILVLVFIIIKIFVGNVALTNKKVSSTRPIVLEEVEKNLHESDLDRYLREALTNKNYRVAVRLYYLMIIKELSARNLIKWKLDKTNRDYLTEMSSHKSFPDFRNITRTFDKVWYGEFALEQNDFTEIGPLFEQYIKQIKS